MSHVSYLWYEALNEKNEQIAHFVWLHWSLWWNQNQDPITWWDATWPRNFHKMRLTRAWRRFDKSELSKRAPRFSTTGNSVRWFNTVGFVRSRYHTLKVIPKLLNWVDPIVSHHNKHILFKLRCSALSTTQVRIICVIVTVTWNRAAIPNSSVRRE